MRIVLLYMIFCVFCQNIISQNTSKTDSLLKIYSSNTADSNKIKALNLLFQEYRYSDELLATKYVNLAIDFGSKTNHTKGYAQALYNKGVAEGEHGNFDSSDYFIDRSLIEYKKINDADGIAHCNMAYGFNLYDKSNFTKALSFFLEASRIQDKIKDTKALAGCYIWVGNVYNNGLKKPTDALTYYKKALVLQQALRDEYSMAFTYNNMGNAYYFSYNLPEALKNYLESVRIKESLGNKKGLGNTYDNIGNIYFDLHNYTDALKYYDNALKIREEFGDKKGIHTSYFNIGNVYIHQKNYDAASDILQKALKGAEEIQNKEVIRDASNSLSVVYEEKGDFSKALFYYKYSYRMNDSILNSDFTSQIAEMQTKYDVEKKDLELVKNKAEIEAKERQSFIKNIIIGSVIALSVLLFIVGLLFYRKKQIEQQAKLDTEIAHQKETRTKAILDAEEKERRRIAQDLHDGVGQLLSAAKLNLSNLDSKITAQTDEQKLAMQNALSLVDDSVKEVRAVSHNMMPNTLIKLGLASAVREFITKLGNAPNLKVDLEIMGLDNRLDNQIETVLYRVIQEVVNNIIKHAKASHISMQLIRHETELNVMIEDNGIGFDSDKLDAFEGIGLKGIQTRIEFLNGSVHFDSSVGRGTTVIIDVPLV